MQQRNMAPQQYADDTGAKFFMVADVHDEGTLNYVLIEALDASLHNYLQH